MVWIFQRDLDLVSNLSSKGPLPRFAETHIHLVLELIAWRKRMGRMELARKLGIGEGSVRTILNQLKEQGFIISSRGGHALTTKGRNLLGKPFTYTVVDAGDITVGNVNVATVVRNAAKRVRRGVEQRDEAIKVGAQGATVLIFEGGKFRFPDNFLKVDKKISNTFTKLFKPREGDVVVIGTAEDVRKAEAGAKAAARPLFTTQA